MLLPSLEEQLRNRETRPQAREAQSTMMPTLFDSTRRALRRGCLGSRNDGPPRKSLEVAGLTLKFVTETGQQREYADRREA